MRYTIGKILSGKDTSKQIMKRKTTNLLVLFLCFLILVLIALGIFMTWLTDEQTKLLKSRLSQVRPDLSSSNEEELLSYNTSSDKVPNTGEDEDHHFIFVGDSRTVGMEEAVAAQNADDTCIYIGKVGEGFHWLSQDGIELLDTALTDTPDATVIFNLGVNDLGEIQQYLDFYPKVFSSYPDTSFYIMSVNPVDDSFASISNEEIESFNQQLQDAFPGQFLNCYNYLKSEGFDTADGLHYTYETYQDIHHYTIMILSEDK